MADSEETEPNEYEVISNFAGRVENISLPANAPNALKPLFEAVSNALHSIDDRFRTRVDKGDISIVLHHEDGKSELGYSGFTVRDNGVGFTDKNFESFRTSDSRNKRARGGKGVGRLLWLKTAERAIIESQFTQGKEKFVRTFDFVVADDKQILNHSVRAAEGTKDQYTHITIAPFNKAFASHFPKKRSTVSYALIRHFLRSLIADRVPRITVSDDHGTDNLHDILKEAIIDQEPEQFDLTFEGGVPAGAFIVKHMLISRKIEDDERGTNAIHLCAHMRAVDRHVIDNQIGMKVIDGDKFYAAIAEADILDGSVNQERSAFMLSKPEMEQITATLTDKAKNFLAPFIQDIRGQQVSLLSALLDENPHFRPVVSSVEDFVESKLALNERNDEQIFVALSRENRREKKRREKEYKAIEKEPKYTELVEQKMSEYAKFVNDTTKGFLESYVRQRKAILDVLEKYKGWDDKEAEDYVLEKAVHELIIPLGSTKDSLPPEKHNLWILDERLAFYGYFASDKQLDAITVEESSGSEPDLSFFDVGFGFRRDLRRDPVMLVEFKRPGKESYNDKTDPLRQVCKYMDELTEGKTVRDHAGTVITQINDQTVFICYIIADLTNGLIDRLKSTPIINPTPDGRGRFGYMPNYRAYVEVIPYDKLWEDASMRNEIFFKKLGLIS